MWSFIWSYTVVYTVGNQCVARFKKPVHMVTEVIGIGFPFRPISSKIIGNQWSAAKGLSVHPYWQHALSKFVLQAVDIVCLLDYHICDMIKGNESDVGNIDFELQAKRGEKFLRFTLFLNLRNCSYLCNQ